MSTKMTQEERKAPTLFVLLQDTCAQSLFWSFQLERNGVLVASVFCVSLSPKWFEMEQKRVFRVSNPEFYSWTVERYFVTLDKSIKALET